VIRFVLASIGSLPILYLLSLRHECSGTGYRD
jgi:hypothetical protein